MNREQVFRRAGFIGAVVVAAVLLLGVIWLVWAQRPRLTEEEVQSLLITTLERETPASFFVTGTLDINATVRVENTKYLLRDLLDFSLGTTRSTVRVPGRVSYGFDVTDLKAGAIRVMPDGIIEVAVPALEVFAVEPDLDRIEVETEVGWARLHARSGQRVEQAALQHVQEALARQGAQHLETSDQPRINTARALERLMLPVLEAAGIEQPRFRFQLGPRLVLEPEG